MSESTEDKWSRVSAGTHREVRKFYDYLIRETKGLKFMGGEELVVGQEGCIITVCKKHVAVVMEMTLSLNKMLGTYTFSPSEVIFRMGDRRESLLGGSSVEIILEHLIDNFAGM